MRTVENLNEMDEWEDNSMDKRSLSRFNQIAPLFQRKTELFNSITGEYVSKGGENRFDCQTMIKDDIDSHLPICQDATKLSID